MTTAPDYCVVVPTLGRPGLGRCLAALGADEGPAPRAVVVVDDRPDTPVPLAVDVPPGLAGLVRVPPRAGGTGPAAARNDGWRAAPETEWVVFLDDDVETAPGWRTALACDLEAAGRLVGGVAGRIVVPAPAGRRPTDDERRTLGLARAHWATADLAYRRAALQDVGGFDERFTRAYREDADLAVRVRRAGWALARGTRRTVHPLRPHRPWSSLAAQRGNADDALMARLHGRRWRWRADAGPGRIGRHALTTALAAGALGALVAHRPRWAAAAAAGWLASTAEFAARRIAAGPWTPGEVADMALTSVAIPPLAVAQRGIGAWRHRDAQPWPGRVEAVVFDGHDVLDAPAPGPPVPGPRSPRRLQALAAVTTLESLERLHAAGIRIGLVGEPDGTASVLGPVDARTDRSGEGAADILRVLDRLGRGAEHGLVVGDTAASLAAAREAGVRALLVPTARTRAVDLVGARVGSDLADAVGLVTRGEA